MFINDELSSGKSPLIETRANEQDAALKLSSSHAEFLMWCSLKRKISLSDIQMLNPLIKPEQIKRLEVFLPARFGSASRSSCLRLF